MHNLNYKTVRYPGHRDMIRMLVRDLRLCERRDIFKDLIEHGIPVTRQDVVLVFRRRDRQRDGLLTQENYVKKIYGDAQGSGLSAIQATTAAGFAPWSICTARASCRRRDSCARRTRTSTPSSPTASAGSTP